MCYANVIIDTNQNRDRIITDDICFTLQAAMGCGGGNILIILYEESTVGIAKQPKLGDDNERRNMSDIVRADGVGRRLRTDDNLIETFDIKGRYKGGKVAQTITTDAGRGVGNNITYILLKWNRNS